MLLASSGGVVGEFRRAVSRGMQLEVFLGPLNIHRDPTPMTNACGAGFLWPQRLNKKWGTLKKFTILAKGLAAETALSLYLLASLCKFERNSFNRRHGHTIVRNISFIASLCINTLTLEKYGRMSIQNPMTTRLFLCPFPSLDRVPMIHQVLKHVLFATAAFYLSEKHGSGEW